jgi:pyrroline-5-carboxylate reductase
MLKTILIVGCGNMGGAMLAGWLAAGRDPGAFTVVDPVLAEVPPGVTLLLGIKPQTLDSVAADLAALIYPETLLLSILAGVELESLASRFPTGRGWVRVMPNLAAALGKSPLALVGRGLDSAASSEVIDLLAPLGAPEWLADEGLFNLATALVGSGPAFVYRFIDALAAGGAALGFAPKQAERFAVAMVEGAARLAATSGEAPGVLARKVASPGGTTEAGLTVLDADSVLSQLVEATLRAARDRGAELAKAAR